MIVIDRIINVQKQEQVVEEGNSLRSVFGFRVLHLVYLWAPQTQPPSSTHFYQCSKGPDYMASEQASDARHQHELCFQFMHFEELASVATASAPKQVHNSAATNGWQRKHDSYLEQSAPVLEHSGPQMQWNYHRLASESRLGDSDRQGRLWLLAEGVAT